MFYFNLRFYGGMKLLHYNMHFVLKLGQHSPGILSVKVVVYELYCLSCLVLMINTVIVLQDVCFYQKHNNLSEKTENIQITNRPF